MTGAEPTEPPPPSAPDPGGPPPPAAPSPAPVPATPPPRLLDLLAAGGVYVGLFGLVWALTGEEVLARAEFHPATFLWLQVVDDGLLTAVAVLFGRLRFPGAWDALGFRRVRPHWWAMGAGGGVAAAASAWAITAGLEGLGWPAPPHPVETVLTGAEALSDFLVILLAVTIPVAIGEEVFFRGLASSVLRARFGGVAGAGGTALGFALVHGIQVGAWLPLVAVGLVFVLLVERSGSLYPAMVAHAIANALAVLLGRRDPYI